MPNSLKISVITPSYNSASTIAETIESVRDQDFACWEHLVMDGGSNDGTVDILRRYPKLTWVSEKDEGHFDAMNKGIRRATGDLIVILNADDCFRPGALREVAAAFGRHPEWDASFGDVVYIDTHGKKIYQREEAVYDFKVLLYAVDYICHHTLFVRRQTYERLGLYRHKDFWNSTDYEFKLRLGREGCRVGHVPALLVNFRYHALGQSSDKRIIKKRIEENARIRAEFGSPGGRCERFLGVIYKLKRQFQKLLYRGRCDLIPGTWYLKAYLKEKTDVTSNVGVDKL